MSKVYILMDGGHDYSAAKEYGELVMVGLTPSMSYDTSRVFSLLSEAMREADGDDCIVVSGITTFCCIAVGFMVDWYQQANILLFSDGRYMKKTITYGNVLDIGDSCNG